MILSFTALIKMDGIVCDQESASRADVKVVRGRTKLKIRRHFIARAV